MACQSFNMQSTLARQVVDAKFSISYRRKVILSRGSALCSVIQESSTAAAVTEVKKEETVAKESPQKPRKPPAKSLPEMMEEEVIPALKKTLEAQEDISDIDISFQDKKLEGSFLKNNGVPYSFWAFFPDGVLTGPKGFSLSSYGSGVSTVEPFLIDERRIAGKQVVFWVRKRLAAQGIIPV
ncbi:uncharacterized protein LOC121992107 [Zingiber officinale]|nr:uncharacterized protein LOC121992107 [Zingiber officinale]